MRAVLLIDHGSKRSAAHRQLTELGQRLDEHLRLSGASFLVEVAHMELSEPTIATGVRACVDRGATELCILPCFLSRGRHVTEDIPALVKEAAAQFPELQVTMAPPLVELEGFIPLLASVLLSSTPAQS